MSSQVKVSKVLPSPRADQHILTVAKGGVIVFAGLLFKQGGRFVIGVLQSRLLGPEQLGMCHLALTATTVAASLAMLGLTSALVRYVSLSVSRRDTAGLWGTLQVGLGLPAIVSVFAGAGLFALAGPIAGYVFREPRLVPLLRMVSLAVPFFALGETTAAATQGFKKMQYAAIARNISQPLIRLVLLVVLAIIVGLNSARALATYTIAVIAVAVMLLYFLNRLFSLRRPLREGRRDTREMLGFALPVYLSGLIGTFGGNVKTVLLGALNTVTSVGIFVVADQVNVIGRLFHGSITAASAPIISELYDRGEREQLGRFYQTVTKWTFTLNLPMFLIVLLFPGPILSIFGKSFMDGATALVILAWANLVDTGTGICGLMIDMTGNTPLKLVNSLVTFVLVIGLDVLLIPRWGLIGVAVASVATSVAVNLLRLLEVYLLFRLQPYNRTFLKPVAAGLIAMAAAWGVPQVFPFEAKLVYTAINAGILLAAYAGMVLVLRLSEEDRTVLARLRRHAESMLLRNGRHDNQS
jgi:O-antigen/teichoic acid export membrane protein